MQSMTEKAMAHELRDMASRETLWQSRRMVNIRLARMSEGDAPAMKA